MNKGDALLTHEGRAVCGMPILATVSQQLAAGFGAGLNPGQAIVVTLSRQSRGSHLQALLPIQARRVGSSSR